MGRNRQIITIFGGTGDLTKRKLLPALYNLLVNQQLPESFHLVIVGRRPLSSEAYREDVRTWIQDHARLKADDHSVDRFLGMLSYFKMVFTEEEGYHRLKDYYQTLDSQASHLYYFAVSPSFFSMIAHHIEKAGLEHDARIIIEKPFGENLESAIEINKVLSQIFTDANIYRIDHYVAKEMVQNIFTIRFANMLFKRVWDHQSIQSIQITVNETVGVENRGAYYDHTGALKDMIQNHLLQILSMVTMEEPKSMQAEDLSAAQEALLQKLVYHDGILGQYEGYLDEANVDPKSCTETYVALKLEIDNPRWKNVPIYLRTGKALKTRESKVVIAFKPENEEEANILIIRIQPDEGVYLKFNIKKPGTSYEKEAVFMDFCQSCIIENRLNTPEAYERMLYAAMNYDKTLFASFEMVRLSWSFVERLTRVMPETVYSYPPASHGPPEADAMLARDGHQWIEEKVLGNSDND